MPLLTEFPITVKTWHEVAGGRNGVPAAASPVQKAVKDVRSWQPTIQKILDFQHLRDDWDGLGALAPSRELLDSAIALAYLFFDKGVDPPHSVVPGLDGSVNFEWQGPEGTIAEVEIDRPHHADVMLIEPGKPPKFWTLPTE